MTHAPRMMVCKGFNDLGHLMWTEFIPVPPPVWYTRTRIERQPDISDPLDVASGPVLHVEYVYFRIGVEVDNDGTWVRYARRPGDLGP